MLLQNKVILIVGAAGKIGVALVRSVIAQGGNVVAVDLSKELLDEVFGEEKPNLRLIAANMVVEEQVKELFRRLPHLDGAVNCTYPRGKSYGTGVAELSMAAFNETVDLHLGAAYLFCQQAVCYFQEYKRPFSLVNMSSVYGVIAPKFQLYEGTHMTMPIEYAAIKSAIIHLNRYVAKLVQNSDFRVNSVSPGGILENQPPQFLERYRSNTCGTGMLQAEDVCGAILFLLSDLARFVNGQNIVVDDGFTL